MTPAYLDLLRTRQRKACAAVARAEKSRHGVGEARRRFILATADLLRATLKVSRQTRPTERRSTAPDLFQQMGA